MLRIFTPRNFKNIKANSIKIAKSISNKSKIQKIYAIKRI